MKTATVRAECVYGWIVQNCTPYENTVNAIDAPSRDTAGGVLSVGSDVICVGGPPEIDTRNT